MNKLITPQVVANEALMALTNNLVAADLVHRDYEKEFKKVGDTITIRKPAQFTANNFTGETKQQDIDEGSVDVKLDHFRDVTFAVTSKEMSLEIDDFSNRLIVPAMQAIAQSVDSDIIAEGIGNAGITVEGTSSATDLKDLANISKELDLNSVPSLDRRLLMHPTHKYRYLTTDNLSKVAYAGDSLALKNAQLGRVYGLDTFMSQNTPDTSAATPGTIKTAKIECTAGANTVKLTNVTTATATIKKGDGFILDGYRYTFTADATASGGTIESIAINEPIHKTISSAHPEDIYVITKTHSLAFHKNGLALVTRQLELPFGAAKAAIASANGLAVRVVIDYNAKKKQDEISIDTLYGVKALEPKMVAKLVG